MSGSVPVVESAHVERPTKPPTGDGSFAERVLADVINRHPGPIIEEEDLEVLDANHDTLGEELREIVCDDSQESEE